MPSAGFETAIPAVKWLRTHTLDRKATWIGVIYIAGLNIKAEKPHKCPQMPTDAICLAK
jgi:hypothetical protein